MTAIADVLPMPAIRLVPVQRLSFERRMQLLENLARTALDRDPEEVAVLRDVWAHDSLCGPQLEERWQDYLERLAIADGVEQGVLDWRCVDPELRCPERTTAAIEISRRDAGEALAYLAGGSAATTGGKHV